MSARECRELRDRLQEILEEDLQGGLSPADRERLAAHAKSCPDCGELLHSYKSLLSALNGMPAVKAPPEFAKRVLERIASERPAAPAEDPGARIIRFRWRIAGRLVRVAALILVAAGGWFLAERLTSQKSEVPSGMKGVEIAKAPAAAPLERPVASYAAKAEKAEQTAGALRSWDRQELPLAEVAPETLKKESLDFEHWKGFDFKQGPGQPEKESPAALAADYPVKPAAPPPPAPAKAPAPEGDLLAFALPAQVPERMDLLLGLVYSVAPEAVVKDDLEGHRRLISFEIDPQDLPALRTSLENFQAGMMKKVKASGPAARPLAPAKAAGETLYGPSGAAGAGATRARGVAQQPRKMGEPAPEVVKREPAASAPAPQPAPRDAKAFPGKDDSAPYAGGIKAKEKANDKEIKEAMLKSLPEDLKKALKEKLVEGKWEGKDEALQGPLSAGAAAAPAKGKARLEPAKPDGPQAVREQEAREQPQPTGPPQVPPAERRGDKGPPAEPPSRIRVEISVDLP